MRFLQYNWRNDSEALDFRQEIYVRVYEAAKKQIVPADSFATLPKWGLSGTPCRFWRVAEKAVAAPRACRSSPAQMIKLPRSGLRRSQALMPAGCHGIRRHSISTDSCSP